MNKKNTIEEIINLIERFLRREISAQEFCTTFEQIWNFELEAENVPDEIFDKLGFLCDEVVLFSPFPREQWEYPKYRDELEIRAAATNALLSINNSQKSG